MGNLLFLLLAVVVAALGITASVVARPIPAVGALRRRRLLGPDGRSGAGPAAARGALTAGARPGDRSGDGQHAGLRPGGGHRLERALRDRAEQRQPRGVGRRPRRLADDRPHAGPHRGRAAAAGRCHHRLRRHPAHDPPGPRAGGRQSVQPAPGGHLRARRPSPRSSAEPSPRRPDGPGRPTPNSSSSRWRPPSAPTSPSTSPGAAWSSTSAAAPPSRPSSRWAGSSRCRRSGSARSTSTPPSRPSSARSTASPSASRPPRRSRSRWVRPIPPRTSSGPRCAVASSCRACPRPWCSRPRRSATPSRSR